MALSPARFRVEEQQSRTKLDFSYGAAECHREKYYTT